MIDPLVATITDCVLLALAATLEDLKMTNGQLFSANERLEFVQVALEYSKAREANLESLLESIRDPSKEFPLEIAHLEFPIPIPPIYALPADEKPGEYPTRFYIPRRDGTFYQLVCSKNCYWQSAGTNILELRRVPTYPGIDLNKQVVDFAVSVVINGQPVGAPATLIVDDKKNRHHEIPYPQFPVPRLPVRAPRG